MPFWTIRASVTGMCSGRLEARLAAGGGVQIYSMWTQKATNICTDRYLNHGKLCEYYCRCACMQLGRADGTLEAERV